VCTVSDQVSPQRRNDVNQILPMGVPFLFLLFGSFWPPRAQLLLRRWARLSHCGCDRRGGAGDPGVADRLRAPPVVMPADGP